VQPDPVLRPEGDDADGGLDQALRPRSFDEFVGQKALLDNLRVSIRAAQGRDEPLDHLLLSGLPGLGKTTLAHLVAKELSVECRATSGPALVRAADLAGILTNLAKGDLLFIDEIHRLPAPVEELLYSAMEDYAIDILIDQGPAARSVRVPLQRFTLAGATTREGMLSAPLRGRFGLLEKLDLYPVSEVEEIVRRSAGRLSVGIDEAAVTRVARVARGTPRVANRLVRRLRDFAQVSADGRITEPVAVDALKRLGIDDHGLCETDRRILVALHRAGGGPVGIKTIAVAVGEEPETVEDVYEPFLLVEGWLLRTPRGRRLTDRAAEWLAKSGPAGRAGQGSLFR
jgi:Holliday junction DNA helicase RuvB